jgi:mono/diheme cytochrome c family protein
VVVAVVTIGAIRVVSPFPPHMIPTSESESGGVLVRSRLMVALTLVVLVVAALGLVGCVESSEEAAQTPSGASTVANSALQTDSEGKTITAPAAGGAQTGGGAETGGAETGGGGAAGGGGEAPAGDAAAGEQVFAANCTGCHLNNGQDAGGVGPQLTGIGWTEQQIHDQVVNGGGAMPGGLVSGEDLDNVVAYVVSLQ